MPTEIICARCGTSLSAQTLDGLCSRCVGRGLLLAEVVLADEAMERPAETPRTSAVDSPAWPEPGPGDKIGEYRLVRILGEGGFGVVYLAEQLQPVKRQVALKVVKLGMDTRQVVARFEAERQALALMDHPGIARVYDAGATEAGRPFFVMELVEGRPITEYADAQELTVPRRLKLFLKVCDAVQHAHQKGVIHRDLKPSNILVTLHGEIASPKIIDFGLAKATQVELTDKTLITQFQQFVGTPAYMSPEQVEMGAVDVDTRSDIYALGVLLYELLTGSTPLEARELLRGGMADVVRRLRETEPPRPSMRLSALRAGEAKSVARRRRTSPERLGKMIHGDLDWIVMKALEKNRARRYETANALALDIQRHLHSEPVQARPPTALYQFQKLVRRHRLAVGAAASVTLALLIGLSIATVAFIQERQARRDAGAKAEEIRQQVVRLNVATGNELVENGEYFNALLWFVEALHLDENDPARADIHRRRIGVVLRSAPHLAQLWFHSSLARGAVFTPDDEGVVTFGWDHLACFWDSHTGQAMRTPLRHIDDLEDALFSKDGRRMVTCDRAGRVTLWDTETGQRLGPNITTKAAWAAFGFSPNERWLLAGVTNGVQLFEVANGATAGPVIPCQRVQSLGISPDSRSAVVGGSRGSLLLELPSGQLKWNFPDTGGMRFAEFSPDGLKVATLMLWDLRVWDTSTGELALPVIKPGGHLFDCHFSPDGRRLVVSSWEGFARVYDATTGQPTGQPMRHRKSVTRATPSPDGRWVATASRDGTARIWRLETGEPASPPLPHSGYVYSANFSKDSTRLVTAGQDQSVRLWDLKTNQPARLVLNHSGGITAVQFSPDGSRILTGSYDGLGRIWDAQSGKLLVTCRADARVMQACLSPDGRLLLLGSEKGDVSIWDTHGPAQLMPTPLHAEALVSVAFSPNAQQFLTAAEERRARVWSVPSGEPVSAWMNHADLITHAAFSPDGNRVVTASKDTTAQVWDARSGAPIGAAMKHHAAVTHASFSPDGRRVLTTCGDRRELSRAAQLWDAATGLPVGQPMRHQDGVSHAEFSADGKRIATSGQDDCAMVWDSATGRPLSAPMRHQDDVPHVYFSPNGRLLLTVSSDYTARVWDANTGEPVTPPLRHESPVLNGAWSPDNREVITGADAGNARVWDISPSDEDISRLRRQAELLSAHRLERNVGSVELTTQEIRQRWEERR